MACPDLERLEVLAHDEPAAPEDDRRHVQSCAACQDAIAEMRAANAFLSRFQGRSAEAAPGPIAVRGYEIEGVIGHGGQGTVYRARQRSTGRRVAIKAPLGDSLRSPSTRYRFRREIEITAQLSHPGIVRVFGDCDLGDGRLACVMEFVDGAPIDVWAAGKRGRAGVRRIVEVIRDVADAIAYAHQRAVVHRDIKPSNVVVTAEGEARVLDFGLAKAIGHANSFATVTGAFVGTMAFAAPEQVSGRGETTDVRTDVYALGLLLFLALTGEHPLAVDASAAEMIRQIREEAAPRPSSKAAGIPEDLDAIVLKALSKEKGRRYASAGEFRDDLEAWLAGRAVQARLDSRWYVIQKTVRRHRWAVLAGALVLAGLVGLGTLGLIAREQAARATLAHAVRDARVLESHWVRLADARATGRDNFEVGETAAWDALLEPDEVLVEAGIEGVDEGGPVRTSPAYWALWEMYQRTPLAFTAPAATPTLGALGPGDGEMTVLDAARGEAQVWNWREARLLRSTASPAEGVIALSPSLDGLRHSLIDAGGGATVLDARLMQWSTILDDVHVTGSRESRDHAAATVRLEDGSFEIRLLEAATGEEAARWPIGAMTHSMTFDMGGDVLAVIAEDGEVLLANTRTGEEILRRPETARPRYVLVHSRGVPGELILTGPGVFVVLDVHGDVAAQIEEPSPSVGFLDGTRQLAGAESIDQYVVITDRWRVGLGDHRRSLTEGRWIEGLSASGAYVDADGEAASLQVRPSSRMAVLALENAGVRRLPFDAPVTDEGFATIFDLEYVGSDLLACAMDGSVRRFAPDGSHEIIVKAVPGGLTSLCAAGGAIYAGTHDLGGGTARVVSVGDGTFESLIEGERWICGLEATEDRIWVMTGAGRLILLDAATRQVLRAIDVPRSDRGRTARSMVRLAHRGALLVGPSASGFLLIDEESLEPIGPPLKAGENRSARVCPSDPDLLAMTNSGGSVELWRFEGDELVLVRALGSHAGAVFSMTFSPDGTLLVSGGGAPESRDVRIWDVAHGRELAALDLFELGVFDLAFSGNGRWLAAAGEVELAHPEAGGQLYLIDMTWPARAIAGNLEHHLRRFEAAHGRAPMFGEALRAWVARGVATDER